MKIFGIQKLTLVDYPGKTAATVFMSGCDYLCPFCYNASLIEKSSKSLIETREVIDFLTLRRNLLDGVCVSGGEPLLQDGIEDFIMGLKDLGYDIKLDTNGQNPTKLKQLVNDGLLDYVAMDIKNSLQNYSKAVGIENFDTCKIEESADFLLGGAVAYEFRTTVVKELHEAQDFHLIGKRFKGAKKYFLQTFKDTGSVLKSGLTPYRDKEMQEFCDIISAYDINATMRGS